MRYCEIITEGRVHKLDLGGRFFHPEVVVQNPTLAQARSLIRRSRQEMADTSEAGRFILRGLLTEIGDVFVWDGWKLLHQDVIAALIQPEHASDCLMFLVRNSGFATTAPGNVAVVPEVNRYIKTILQAIT